MEQGERTRQREEESEDADAEDDNDLSQILAKSAGLLSAKSCKEARARGRQYAKDKALKAYLKATNMKNDAELHVLSAGDDDNKPKAEDKKYLRNGLSRGMPSFRKSATQNQINSSRHKWHTLDTKYLHDINN
jgi:hypothetical protein